MIDMKTHNPGPIRSSLAILIIKLVCVVLLADLAYMVVSYILTLQLELSSLWHHRVSAGLVVLQLLKVILEVALIFYVTLDWFNHVYEFTEQNLIIRRGAMRKTEEIYELKHLRLASIKQTFSGKILGFGNIELVSSIPGSSEGKILLYGVANPSTYEPIIKACLAGVSL